MNYSKISIRYAKALFTLAKEKNILEEIHKDIQLIDATCKTDEMVYFLNSPTVNSTDKTKAINSLFQKKINENTLAFLALILENKREIFIQDIDRNFFDLYKKELGVKAVKLVTTSPIDEINKNEIIALITKHYKSKIELEEETNKDLIGGFILRVDNQQYDTSVAKNLKSLKRELINTSFDKKLV